MCCRSSGAPSSAAHGLLPNPVRCGPLGCRGAARAVPHRLPVTGRRDPATAEAVVPAALAQPR